MEMLGQTYENEPPLKLGPCTIAYMLPFLKSMLGKCWMYLFHVSRINIHLYGSMEKFHKVWNQEIT